MRAALPALTLPICITSCCDSVSQLQQPLLDGSVSSLSPHRRQVVNAHSVITGGHMMIPVSSLTVRPQDGDSSLVCARATVWAPTIRLVGHWQRIARRKGGTGPNEVGARNPVRQISVANPATAATVPRLSGFGQIASISLLVRQPDHAHSSPVRAAAAAEPAWLLFRVQVTRHTQPAQSVCGSSSVPLPSLAFVHVCLFRSFGQSVGRSCRHKTPGLIAHLTGVIKTCSYRSGGEGYFVCNGPSPAAICICILVIIFLNVRCVRFELRCFSRRQGDSTAVYFCPLLSFASFP
jgi:hypothetical protein